MEFAWRQACVLARVDAARLVAYGVLRRVDTAGAYANLELAKQLKTSQLSGQDAAFATELVGGTLRMSGAYDAVLDQLVKGELKAEVRDALRLGVHQLLSMRVPAHAAVTTTVDLVRQEIGRAPTGLVNAVLRRVSQQSAESWLAGLSAAQRFSHPQWIVDELAEALDRPAELESLLLANNERPVVNLVARPGLASVAELGGRPSAVSEYGVILDGGAPGEIQAVREGRAGVQDAGSQLVALLTAVPDVAPDGPWLDLCAGPGGKAALLAALAKQRGTHLVANESAPHRARLVKQNLRATGGDVIVADGRAPAWRQQAFSRVLVDAPCTGLGALRRRPEARWRRSPEDLVDLVVLQRELLKQAVASTQVGGVVCYATCSPVVSETSKIVTEALGTLPVRLEDATLLTPHLSDAESAHLQGAIQLWPHRHGTDAMFIALMRRY